MIQLGENFRERYPDTRIGLLAARGVENPSSCAELDRAKAALEGDIRTAFQDKEAIKNEPVVQTYKEYYKRFKSTYHVLNQVASVALKGRSIPQVAALVEAMFMAELKNMVLTSGHDLAAMAAPFFMDAAQGGESFTMLAGREASVKPGDIILVDARGPAGSVIYGPDQRTMIRPETTEALFVAWGVPGLGKEIILSHLRDLEGYLKLIAPGCRVEELDVV